MTRHCVTLFITAGLVDSCAQALGGAGVMLFRCAESSIRLRLVSIPHCNLPQDQTVLKRLKFNSTPCVKYGLF